MAADDWWDVMCVILLLAGVGGGCFMQGCLRLVECCVCHLAIGWRVWGRWSLSGSTGRLPQIIRIGKFHAWLLMIGGMLCVSSCYWLVREEDLVCSPCRLIRTGQSVECLGVTSGFMYPSLLLAASLGHVWFGKRSEGYRVGRVSLKHTKINFGSNRNKPKQDLFRICFGLFRETKKKKFRFVSMFRTYIKTTETNRSVL